MIKFSEFYRQQKILLENLESYEKDMTSAFGDKLEEKRYHITREDSEKLFDILNRHVFNGDLKPIPIRVEDFSGDLHVNDDGEYYIGRHVVEYNFDKPIEVDGEKSFEYKNWIVLVNTDLISFREFIEIMCHEMIHYYDLLYGFGRYGFESSAIEKYLNGKPDDDAYTGHGDYFDRIAKRIKGNYGIDVKEEHNMDRDEFERKYSKKSFTCESDNQRAIEFAKKLRRFVKDDGTNKIEVDGSKVRFIMM